jgi:hypothetical protein
VTYALKGGIALPVRFCGFCRRGGWIVAFLRNRNREIEAQRWILKMVNNHCPELRELQDGPRLEGRVNLTLPAWIVPIEGKMPVIARAFPVVSKEFSPSGFSVVINRPFEAERVLAGFAWDEERAFFKGEVQHISPLGAGFSQMGVLVHEMLCLADHRELDALIF